MVSLMRKQSIHRQKLTKRVVESIVPNPEKRTYVWDTEVIGFGLRIQPTGRKTYFLQFRNQYRTNRKIKIGMHGNITTERARDMAVQLMLRVNAGEDPSQESKDKRTKPSIEELAHEYIELHAKINKRPKSYKEDKAMLENIILKNLGTLKVEEITSQDILRLHKNLKKIPYMANRVRALLSKMFTLAVQWGWRSTNPVLGVEKYQEQKRNRWLADDELKRLMKVLKEYHNQSVANAIRLLILTGSRRSEVLTATWDQFDLIKGVWTKPAHTTKQKKMEHLPLSLQVVTLLKEMQAQAKGTYLFPGRVQGKPLQEIKKAWNTIKKRAELKDVRLHDLRHTHASHLVSSGLSLSIVGKLLGHTQASTTQRYAHLADEPLRQATTLFADKIEQLVGDL